MSLNRIGLLLPVVLFAFMISVSSGCGDSSTPTAPETGSVQQYLDEHPELANEEDAEAESEEAEFDTADGE